MTVVRAFVEGGITTTIDPPVVGEPFFIEEHNGRRLEGILVHEPLQTREGVYLDLDVTRQALVDYYE